MGQPQNRCETATQIANLAADAGAAFDVHPWCYISPLPEPHFTCIARPPACALVPQLSACQKTRPQGSKARLPLSNEEATHSPATLPVYQA
jgi:hypothetical protein